MRRLPSAATNVWVLESAVFADLERRKHRSVHPGASELASDDLRAHSVCYRQRRFKCGFEGSSASRPVSVIHGWENVIHALDIAEPLFVNPRRGELIVERCEAEQVIFHALARIVRAGAAPENKRCLLYTSPSPRD